MMIWPQMECREINFKEIDKINVQIFTPLSRIDTYFLEYN